LKHWIPAFAGMTVLSELSLSPMPLAAQDIAGYISGHSRRSDMSNTPQKRALQNYRSRLSERGMGRFEVLGLDADRDLIRSLARRLAEDGPDAGHIRATVSRTIAGEPPKKGGVLAALRRSPLVGADLDLSRPRETGRRLKL
jgi:hypothetical protein